jgi:hypothetical protein
LPVVYRVISGVSAGLMKSRTDTILTLPNCPRRSYKVGVGGGSAFEDAVVGGIFLDDV